MTSLWRQHCRTWRALPVCVSCRIGLAENRHTTQAQAQHSKIKEVEANWLTSALVRLRLAAATALSTWAGSRRAHLATRSILAGRGGRL